MFGILIAEWMAFPGAVMQMASIANVVFAAQKDLILVPWALGLILQLEAPVEHAPSRSSQLHRMSGTLSVVGAATAGDASLMVFIASAASATTMITFLAPRQMLRAQICDGDGNSAVTRLGLHSPRGRIRRAWRSTETARHSFSGLAPFSKSGGATRAQSLRFPLSCKRQGCF